MRFIKLKEVMKLTSLSRSSIYLYIQNNKFPKQITIGERSVAWNLSEIQSWMNGKLDMN